MYRWDTEEAEKEGRNTAIELFGKHCSGSAFHSSSSRSGVLNQETELSLANDYHGHVPRAFCVLVGASGRNAFSCKNRQPSSQQLKQTRTDFSSITINLEATWLPLVARLSEVQAGTPDLLGLPLMVTRLLLQLQPEQGGGGSAPAVCVFQPWAA